MVQFCQKNFFRSKCPNPIRCLVCRRALPDFPQLYCLVIRREQEMRNVLALEPFDFVDLLLDLQALQIVKLGLVTLECTVNTVLIAYKICRVHVVQLVL